jgi:Eukaryotic aspartyl protease
MKNSTASATLLVASLLSAQAISASVLSLSISKQTIPASAVARRVKRATILENLSNEISLYSANVTCGTPSQSFTLQIDTGSSDTYLMSSAAPDCERGNCLGGTCK